ncbi:unnamed protein product, partial [Mesorhabditis belari]|uniref:3-beta hydroxysteroid dehydrogenase/isomerase domain-containing protein n=1 Tax=Mesorhabditis belari TaxID=2138241 RepID=A0AAF3J7U1_9BILA
MERVCITGGGGYFGQSVAAEFQKEGFHVNLLDMFFEDTPQNITLDEKKLTKFKGSILDEKLLEESLKDCTSCVHIAAYGMGGNGALNKKLVFATNVDGTNLVIEKCQKYGIRRFINSSSVGVIFTDKELNFAKETQPYPKKYYSYYSESKAIAERLVKERNSASFTTVSLRYRGIFGPGEPRSTNRAAEIIYRGLFFAKIEHSQPAYTQFSGLYNTARACFLADKAIRERPEQVGGKAYHIVDGGPPVESWRFFNPLCKVLNRSEPWLRLPFWLVFYFAWLSEIGHEYFGLPSTLLRLEVALVGITNTYSIESARRDLDYNPIQNHDLTEVCAYYKKFYETNPSFRLEWMKIFISLLISTFFIFYFFW